MRAAWQILKDTFLSFQRDEAMAKAAATAFYTALSLAPALVLVITIAGAVWGPSAVREELADELTTLIGAAPAETLQNIIQRVHNPPAQGLMASISAVTLVLAASAVFSNIQSSLNRIWHVRPRPGPVVWRVVKRRLLALLTLVLMALLIPASIALSTVVQVLRSATLTELQRVDWVWTAANWGASWLLYALLFTALFKVLADAKLAFRDAFVGAVVTATLFALGKELLARYLSEGQVVRAYGGAASLFTLLLWVYYSANILYLGAEFTGAWARHHGRLIRPDEDATWENGTEQPAAGEARRAGDRAAGSAARS